LTAGPGSQHRQFLDLYISQFKKSYLNDLVAYRKILLQRNKLLKDIAENPRHLNQLEAWDKLLIEHAIRIVEERRKFIESIRESALRHYQEFADGLTLELVYMPKTGIDNPDIGAAMVAQLAEYQTRELKAGLTLVGPHRDRLRINLNGRSVRLYGSRGQKRGVMLALKMAVAEYLANISANDIALILDEAFAELDSYKSRSLMNALAGHKQVFIATAGEFAYRDKHIKRFLVSDGVVEEQAE